MELNCSGKHVYDAVVVEACVVVMEVEYLWLTSCWQQFILFGVRPSHANFVPHISLEWYDCFHRLLVDYAPVSFIQPSRLSLEECLDWSDLGSVDWIGEPYSVRIFHFEAPWSRDRAHRWSHQGRGLSLPYSKCVSFQYGLVHVGPEVQIRGVCFVFELVMVVVIPGQEVPHPCVEFFPAAAKSLRTQALLEQVPVVPERELDIDDFYEACELVLQLGKGRRVTPLHNHGSFDKHFLDVVSHCRLKGQSIAVRLPRVVEVDVLFPHLHGEISYDQLLLEYRVQVLLYPEDFAVLFVDPLLEHAEEQVVHECPWILIFAAVIVQVHLDVDLATVVHGLENLLLVQLDVTTWQDATNCSCRGPNGEPDLWDLVTLSEQVENLHGGESPFLEVLKDGEKLLDSWCVNPVARTRRFGQVYHRVLV